MRRFLLTEQFTLMESEGKRLNQRTQKTGNGRTLLRLLHGSWSYFLVCIVSGLVFTGCELLIPQIIRVSVDSFIGNAAVHVRAAERSIFVVHSGFRPRCWWASVCSRQCSAF